MRVPVLERQVQQNPTLINAPQISKAVPGAFGEDVAVATQNVGKAGLSLSTNLLEHIKRQNYYKSEAKGKDAANKLALQQNDLLYSTEQVEAKNAAGLPFIDSQGNARMIAKGYKNRLGFDSHDSTFQYQQDMAGLATLVEESLKNDPVALATFREEYQTLYKTGYNTVNQHEATQWHAGQNNVYASTAANLVSQAEVAQTPELLSEVLNNISKNSESKAKFNGWGSQQLQEDKNADIEKATGRAVMGKLRSEGLLSAQKLLNSIKDKIPQESFDAISEDLEIQAQQATKKDHFQQMIIQNQTESDMVDKYFQGTLVKDDVKQLHLERKISDGFAKSMMNNLDSLQKIGAKTDLTVYDEIMTHIINQDLPVSELRQLIIEKHTIGELSDSDYKHFIYVEKGSGISTVAEDYASEKEKLSRRTKPNSSFWGTIWQLAKKAQPVTPSGLMSNIINRIQKENAQGEPMLNIANDEIRQQLLKDNSSFSSLPIKGKLHRDKYGNTAIIYPDGKYEEVMSVTGDFKHKEQRTKKQGKK